MISIEHIDGTISAVERTLRATSNRSDFDANLARSIVENFEVPVVLFWLGKTGKPFVRKVTHTQKKNPLRIDLDALRPPQIASHAHEPILRALATPAPSENGKKITTYHLLIPERLGADGLGMWEIVDKEAGLHDAKLVAALQKLIKIRSNVALSPRMPETGDGWDRHLKLIGEVAGITNSQRGITEVFFDLVSTVSERLGLSSLDIYTLDRSENQVVQWVLGEEIQRRWVGGLDEGSLGAVRDAITSGSMAETAGPSIDSEDARGDQYLAVPIKVDDKIIGALRFESKRRFNSMDRVTIPILSDLLAQAMENARLFMREKRRSNQLALVNDLSREFFERLDIETILDRLVEAMRQKIAHYNVCFFQIDHERKQAVLTAISGAYKDSLQVGYRVGLNDGHLGRVVKSRKPALAVDHECGKTFRDIDLAQVRSELCVPIEVDGEVYGIFDVLSRRKNDFSMVDVSVMETLADRLAVAIENARLYRRIWSERDKLERILSNLGEGIALVGEDFNVQYMNRWLIDHFGPEAREGTCYKVFTGADTPCESCPYTSSNEQAGVIHTEEKGGTDRIFCFSRTLLRSEGEPAMVLEIIKDVTSQRRLEEEKLQAERLNSVLELSGAVAHEINQPLTGIMGICSILKEEMAQDSVYLPDIKEIENQARRLDKLVRHIQTLKNTPSKEYGQKQKILDFELAAADGEVV